MSKRLSYSPRLDGLRAIAALMVLFAHYLIDVGGPGFRYGWNGVQIFFVISGYLITMILLAQKNDSTVPKIKMTINFIAKRALRLFPVYYVFLSALVLISILTGLWLTKEGTLWHYYTYTQNFLFLKEGFQSPLLNHTWSLAVEEQFYLFWPFIIFFIPRRAEFPVLIAVFLTGVLSKIYFIDYYQAPGTVKGVTFIHFDTLGAGALLAYCMHYEVVRVKKFLDSFCIPLFIAGLIVSWTLTVLGREDSFFLPLSLVVMSVALVYMCTHKTNISMGGILAWPPLVRIGKISYGVYLFHKPVPYFTDIILGRTGILQNIHPVLLFMIYLSIALGIASLSWHLFERHFLRLKEKLDI